MKSFKHDGLVSEQQNLRESRFAGRLEVDNGVTGTGSMTSGLGFTFEISRGPELPLSNEVPPSLISVAEPVAATLQINERRRDGFDAFQTGLSQSIADASTRLAVWGFNQRDTGRTPTVCGCGQCATCSGENGAGNFNPNPNAATFSVNLDQVVYLEFDSGTDGNVNYTQEIRESIAAEMGLVYERFGVTFVLTEPISGDYSTIFFNTGSPGGLAQDIDFRNLNKNDTAVVNIEGFGVTATMQQIIFASANIGAHELGHILGLRHHDAFGPIGGGIPDNLFFPGFDPVFPGPTDADETRRHIMNTPALAGEVADVLQRNWLGEREATKLAFAVIGTTLLETTAPNDTFAQAQAIGLAEIVVPNTIVAGANEDAGDFTIEAVSVVGSFSSVDSSDFYSFQGRAGRFYSFEVISQSTDRYSDNPIDATVSIFDSNFVLVDYYGTAATNDDDVEFGGDSHLFDLQLTENGTFYVQVDTRSSGDAGDYELFIQSFEAVPFNLPTEDDFTDVLRADLARDLEFQELTNNFIARESGVIGFQGSPAERDVFDFTIDSKTKVIVDVRAETNFFDTFVELYNSNNELVKFNNNANSPAVQNPLDSQLIVKNLAAGDYYVVVSGNNASTGSYNVSVRHNGSVGSPDDFGDSFAAASNLTLDPLPQTTFVNGSQELGFDRDVFRFTALGTGTMIVRSFALNGNLNTVLRAFDSNQNLLVANNNFLDTLNSRLAFNVEEGQSYFVRLSSIDNTTGDYRLSLRTIGTAGQGGFGPGGGASSFAIRDPNVQLTLNSRESVGEIAGQHTNLNDLAQFGNREPECMLFGNIA